MKHFFFLFICGWWTLTKLIGGNHFTTHVSQIIMLYPLKLYSVYVKDLLTKLEERERKKNNYCIFSFLKAPIPKMLRLFYQTNQL